MAGSVGAGELLFAPKLPNPLAPLLNPIQTHHPGCDNAGLQGTKSLWGWESAFSATGQVALDFPAMSPVLYMGEGFMDDFHGIHERPG